MHFVNTAIGSDVRMIFFGGGGGECIEIWAFTQITPIFLKNKTAIKNPGSFDIFNKLNERVAPSCAVGICLEAMANIWTVLILFFNPFFLRLVCSYLFGVGGGGG